MEQAISEWFDARTKIVKTIRRMNYRINKTGDLGLLSYRYFGQKEIIIKELRRMDKILRKVLEDME